MSVTLGSHQPRTAADELVLPMREPHTDIDRLGLKQTGGRHWEGPRGPKYRAEPKEAGASANTGRVAIAAPTRERKSCRPMRRGLIMAEASSPAVNVQTQTTPENGKIALKAAH